MKNSQLDITVMNWFAEANQYLMDWTNIYWWKFWIFVILFGTLFGMSPLQTHHQQNFMQIVLVTARKTILYIGMIFLIIPFISFYLFDVTLINPTSEDRYLWLHWFLSLGKAYMPLLGLAGIVGMTIRFIVRRYFFPLLSGMLRKLRNVQSGDSLSDIRRESEKYKELNFDPSKFYKEGFVLVGLNGEKKPLYVPVSTWYETNMQVIGPTRYGKGVIMGGLMEQAVIRGDTVFYIDPKNDRFAPHILYQAAVRAKRKFYYLTLHDEGVGKWAPFTGGSMRDAMSRLEVAFGLEFSGDPGTDYYKSQEKMLMEREFKKTRGIDALHNALKNSDANRINAELERWASIRSLCPNPGTGFSIEKALLENAVVYVQGSLSDNIVKTATKLFINETIQETMRLQNQRKTHALLVIDEVSFLTSKLLAQALATAVGFKVNFVLAYQSQNDLLNLDDKSVNPKYIHQSINVNSQIKAVYGGADFETAEWAANLSGTVIKEVAKLEKTAISSTGGETWENERSIGSQEENYISTNVILTLPPRVCIFVQPRSLAEICFTSYVNVKSFDSLNEHIKGMTDRYEHNQMVNGARSALDPLSQPSMTVESAPAEFIHSGHTSKALPGAKAPEKKNSEARPKAPKKKVMDESEKREILDAVVKFRETHKKPDKASPPPEKEKPAPVVDLIEPAPAEFENTDAAKKRAEQKKRKGTQRAAKKDKTVSVSHAKPLDSDIQNDVDNIKPFPEKFDNDFLIASLSDDSDVMSKIADDEDDDAER